MVKAATRPGGRVTDVGETPGCGRVLQEVQDDGARPQGQVYWFDQEATSWLKQVKAGSLKTWRNIKIALLNNFYDDVMALDAASNGNFITQYPADATALIENLACSNTKNVDFQRKKIAGAVSGNQMAEVHAKWSGLHEVWTATRQLQCQKVYREPEFLKLHSKASLPEDISLEQLLEDLWKIDNLSSHMKKLDVQVAQTTQSIKRQEGFLPGNPNANLRKSCNAIMIRDGDEVWEEVDTEQELEPYVKRLADNGISSDEAKLLTQDISAIMLPKAKKEKAQRVDIAEYIRTIQVRPLKSSQIQVASFLIALSPQAGMTNYRPTKITLLFADCSKRILEGILEDVPVKVGNSLIPTDFVVLDYNKEPKYHILGRAFLATAGARIDVKRGTVSLNICDLEMELGRDGTKLIRLISSMISTQDTPPQTAQNPQIEPPKTLLLAQLANGSCRATVSISLHEYRSTPVAAHTRSFYTPLIIGF
ncbi:hypothetical protein ISN44_Un120g000060 [Arabidopsis suecica]|uniref:Uncharacterized protein n=1 Tax=Arabidopsis suecica TaxID=45249 RepID=A0A8T1XCU5_ARASU|nr:hypothetical protein ISN44_Un120g000060 [Arabidopsis suecica]